MSEEKQAPDARRGSRRASAASQGEVHPTIIGMSGRGSDSAASGGQGSPGWRELLQEAAGGLQAAGARISRWVEEHQDGIEDVAAGLMAIAVLQPKLAELERRFGESEWAYLIERLDFVNGVALMLALSEPGSEGTRDAAVDFLEQVARPRSP